MLHDGARSVLSVVKPKESPPQKGGRKIEIGGGTWGVGLFFVCFFAWLFVSLFVCFFSISLHCYCLFVCLLVCRLFVCWLACQDFFLILLSCCRRMTKRQEGSVG